MYLRCTIFCFFGGALLSSCQTQVHNVSRRHPPGFPKAGTSHLLSQVPFSQNPQTPPELYVKQKNIEIQPKNLESIDGSLMNMEDERNFLFTSPRLVTPGRYVDVHIAVNRQLPAASKASDGKTPAEKTKSDSKQESAPSEKSNEQFLKELLASFPNLAPPNALTKDPVRVLKMKISHRLPNGDAIVTSLRRSTNGTDAKEIAIQARVPYQRMVSGEALSTEDLVDVQWKQSEDGQMTHRYSSHWEDEYTLRLSGFNEASSQYAKSLEDSRQQLEELSDRLRGQVESFASERRTMADQRQNLMQQQTHDEKKISELQAQVQEQKEKIDELSPPEDKPGDTKEGATGDE